MSLEVTTIFNFKISTLSIAIYSQKGRKYTFFSGSPNGSAPDKSSMALYCSVPSGGIIYNYMVEED